MSIRPLKPFRSSRRPESAGFAAVRSFIADHGAALANGARLLGGDRAEGRCLRLTDRVRDAGALSRSDVLDLIAIHRLYMLENVGDPDSVETAFFSAISPEDPRVHELCLIADRLRDLLCEIAEAQEAEATPRELLDHIAA